MSCCRSIYYYPFGMEMEGPWELSVSSPENKYTYNGKEMQSDFGLNWLDYGARFYDPAIGRFGGTDRFAEKYYSLTPYQYGANNPILYIDVNGDSLKVSGSSSSIESFKQVVGNGTGGFYSASVGDDGLVTVSATGKEGEMSKTQQNFADVMTNSASSETGLSEFSLVDHSDKGSKGIIVGDNGESEISATPGVHTIDMGDVQKFGSEGLLTSQGALAHEIDEGLEIQVNGASPNAAHRKALRTESKVNGVATLGGTINSSRTELRVRVQAGFKDVRNVIFKLKKGNIKKVGNNKK